MTSSIDISRRSALGAVAAAAALAIPGGRLFAQGAWPSKPIRMVLGYAPGGGSDVMARAVSQPMTDLLGQSIIVDNKPGASGNIATLDVVRAAPDGYNILCAPTTQITANPYLFKMSSNPAAELTPVAALGRFQLHVISKLGAPFKNIKELIEYGRANPGKLTYASSGPGTPPHLVAEAFLSAAKITALHVPYRGSGPVLQAMLGGEADFAIDPGVAFPMVRAGKLNMLAVASAKRPVLFPDVPTLIESGVPNMEFDAWVGIWVPAGTPPDVIARLNSSISKALINPAVKEKFASLSGEALYLDTPAFKEVIAREDREFSGLIKKLDIKIQ
jgi:tripartite-type tricarboxylate transporter receptor subunit TctC